MRTLLMLMVLSVLAHGQEAVRFNTNFEGAALGKIEGRSQTEFLLHVKGQYDQRGHNRQTSWFAFRIDAAKDRQLSLTLTDFVGEYNDKPGAVPMGPDIKPVYSVDGVNWMPVPDEQAVWDAEKKELTLKITPTADAYYIAHIPLYTTKHLRALLADIDRSPFARIEMIGKTCGGRDIPLVTVTDPATPDDGKKVVWLQARQHAWEAGTSWVMEGALRFITSDDPAAQAIRQKTLFKFTPMVDLDGVAAGNVRFNANGFDVNRHWDKVDLRDKTFLGQMPEIWYTKRAILAQMREKPIALMINMHNTETGEFLDAQVDDPAVQKTMQRLFDHLSEQTTFDPNRPMGFKPPGMPDTNSLWPNHKVPVLLMEQRISTSKKLGRRPTTEDRLTFGKQLVGSMAQSVAD